MDFVDGGISSFWPLREISLWEKGEGDWDRHVLDGYLHLRYKTEGVPGLHIGTVQYIRGDRKKK